MTVNILKWRTYCIWRWNKGNFFQITPEISFWNKNLTETKNCAFTCDKTKKIRGFIYILAAILCFAYLKVKVTRYRILSDRFEFSSPKLCKNKWIANYTLKCLANFNVLDFRHRHIRFRKHRPDMDMYNDYFLIWCFLWPWWLVCLVVYFDFFIIKIMFERMWRDD